MIFIKLLFFSLFLSACITGQDFSHERYMKSVIGSDFKKYVERSHNFYGRKLVRRKNKPGVFKTFRWTETLSQKQSNGTHIYKYANPYSNCRVTFMVNEKGIVIDDFSEGDDCDA